MPEPLLDYLDDGEAQALAGFLVEVLGLEEAIRDALSRFYALPERQEVFVEQFLDRMTLGTAVARLKPVLDLFDVGDKERVWLKELVQIRNTVAHSLPTIGYEADPDEEPDAETFRAWQFPRRKGEPLEFMRVEDIEPYTVMAFRLRSFISRLPWSEHE